MQLKRNTNHQIVHGFGIGDAIMFAPFIKNHCRLNPRNVITLVSKNLLLFQKRLYSDIKNINIIEKDLKDMETIELEFVDAVDHYTWRNLTYTRDLENELAMYEEIISRYGENYIVTHERAADNCNRKMIEINRELINDKVDLPIINLDYEWLIKKPVFRR